MGMKSIKKDQTGFTIIEVMIVLVIAAVILLIVFLAVPAVQRNSRNNQRKTDVSRISSAVAEYASNKGGILPTTYAEIGAIAGQLAHYNLPSGPVLTGQRDALTDAETFRVVTGADCDPSLDGSTVASTGRKYAVQFALETSSDPLPVCVGS